MYDTQHPHIASFVIVRNEEGKIALVLRSNTKWMNGHYGMPSGKVEHAESFSAAAVREAKEEIGIDVAIEDLEHAITVHRYSVEENNDKENMEWVDVYFEVNNYQGEVHNAEPHMHDEVAWFAVDELPDNTIPAVKATLEAWAEGKKYLEYGYK